MRPHAFTAVLVATLALHGCVDPPAPPEAETVVLLHGLGRTELSMALLGTRIEDGGYHVVNVGYPSKEETLEELTERLHREILVCCPARRRDVHFVTHSMGGIIVRNYLAKHSPDHRGRVVMLSPPNQGSEVADAFQDSPLMRTIMGETGLALGTDTTDIPRSLGPADFELGILTGRLSLDPIGSWLIPGPDDGKVSIEAARLEGAVAFKVVDASHTFIMNDLEVAREVLRFLRTGRFSDTDKEE